MSSSEPKATAVGPPRFAQDGPRALRLTASVFRDLGIWMVGLGLLAGAVFPFFVVALGVDSGQALTLPFFGATLLAGLLVGGANWWLARLVVGTRLRALSQGMGGVAEAIHHATETGDWSGCDAGACRLAVDSDDELGDSACAFNQLVEALERFHDVEQAVRELFQALARHLDLDELCGTALRWVAESLGAPAGAVLLVRDGTLSPVAAHGELDPQALCGMPELPAVARGSAVVRLGGASDRQLVAVPIAFGEEPLGLLVVVEAEQRGSDSDLMLDLFSRAFAVALNNALTHAHSQELARIDPLTGCANRRSGLAQLDDELELARDADSALGVLMIDLDHFKRINDAHGHLAGDAVLLHAAEVIRGCLRGSDLLVRYGGEEFLAVLPSASEQTLPEIAERIRAALASAPTSLNGAVVPATASVGAARFPLAGVETAEQLLEHADRALYRAKSAGRNRVIFADAA